MISLWVPKSETGIAGLNSRCVPCCASSDWRYTLQWAHSFASHTWIIPRDKCSRNSFLCLWTAPNVPMISSNTIVRCWNVQFSFWWFNVQQRLTKHLGVSVSSCFKQQRSHQSLADLTVCNVLPMFCQCCSSPCQGGQEAPAHQWEHEVPLGPGAVHQMVEMRNRRNRCRQKMQWQGQWWHESWISMNGSSCGKDKRDQSGALLQCLSGSFCFSCWTQRVSEWISDSKLTLQERSQFMKEEASQLYTTVVIQQFDAVWKFLINSSDHLVFFQNLSDLRTWLSALRHMPSSRHLFIPRTEPRMARMTRGQRRDLTWPHWTTARMKSVSCNWQPLGAQQSTPEPSEPLLKKLCRICWIYVT